MKGENLKNGSIEFLQAGGTVGNKSCYPSHGSYIYFENGVKEDELIFFCKSTDLPSPDDLNKFDNTHKIEIKSKKFKKSFFGFFVPVQRPYFWT